MVHSPVNSEVAPSADSRSGRLTPPKNTRRNSPGRYERRRRSKTNAPSEYVADFLTEFSMSNAEKTSLPTVRWSYAPAPESSSHVQLKPRYDLFINNHF